jgi:hypothetical protein
LRLLITVFNVARSEQIADLSLLNECVWLNIS